MEIPSGAPAFPCCSVPSVVKFPWLEPRGQPSGVRRNSLPQYPTEPALALRQHARHRAPEIVRRKSSFVFLLFAWLCANGAVLDAVQVFAWGKMFAGYAQTMPLAAALRETFDPAKPCELCSAVATAKEDRGGRQAAAPASDAAVKIVLLCDATPEMTFAAARADWPEAFAFQAPSWREPVPLPPPRA